MLKTLVRKIVGTRNEREIKRMQPLVAEINELGPSLAALTDEQKMIAEYWADGPRSETPPGHWNLFAQRVLEGRRTGSPEHDLDEAVTLLFALNNAIFDAGCCAWDAKVAYDSVRPITAVRWLFRGTQVDAWAGPGRGTTNIAGEGTPATKAIAWATIGGYE